MLEGFSCIRSSEFEKNILNTSTSLFPCTPAGVVRGTWRTAMFFNRDFSSLLINVFLPLHLIFGYVPLPSSSSKQRDVIQPPSPLRLIFLILLRADPSIMKRALIRTRLAVTSVALAYQIQRCHRVHSCTIQKALVLSNSLSSLPTPAPKNRFYFLLCPFTVSLLRPCLCHIQSPGMKVVKQHEGHDTSCHKGDTCLNRKVPALSC